MHVTRLYAGHQPSTRYGDPRVIRALARSLRDQAEQVHDEGDRLARKAAAAPWTGLAADAMRRSVSIGTTSLRQTAELHVRAAVALERHADEVERIARLIDRIEREVLSHVEDARRRVAALAGLGVDPVDQLLAHFDPPPSGHRDWLTTHLPVAVPGLAVSEIAGAVLG